ncbi:hypothetical protein [Clostridium cylindrosporum]|uniref:Membrane-spanning protein n=1 Tax=Clostridium cylindrosporum DSM 605 TaxID=1121307 RepID=A0A0J8D462_CLOCY|nr:hypothetical protein [Clostridium cylindrosporum]KMT20970.1 hypothetical protein CLCY_1c02040 [Clostridium cylindrosporum DSM 605]
MKSFKFNYYTVFITLFRIALIVQGIYFLTSGKFPLALYSASALIATFLINIVYRITDINPSMFLKFSIQFLIFLTMYLGHLNSFYILIPRWDDFTHLLSGFIITFFGYLTLDRFNNKKKVLTSNKYFVSIFIIIFGLSAAALWEVFEFSGDKLFSMQSQGGSLDDTMWDIINGTIGPIILVLIYLKNPKLFDTK